MTDKSAMDRFAPAVREVLERAGWSPDRRVPEAQLQAWADSLGMVMPESARQVLGEFGGIATTQLAPGVDLAREPFVLDPLLAVHEEDRFQEFRDSYGLDDLYPLGESAGGHWFIAIDGDGRTYLLMDDIRVLGETFDAALEALAVGRAARRLE
jgi:hypothetical protein